MPAAKVLAPSACGCGQVEVDDLARGVRRAAGAGCPRRHRCWVRRPRRRGVRGAPARSARRRRWRGNGGPGCRRPWRRRRSPTRARGRTDPGPRAMPKTALESTSAVRKICVRDCTGPVDECISAGAELPAEKRRDQREPGQLRTTVQAIAATAMTTIAGIGISRCPRRQRTSSQAASSGSPTSRKTLSTTAAGEVAVQQVVGHPKAAAARAVPARQRLERAGREQEARAVRIAEPDVGEAADENGAGAECAV